MVNEETYLENPWLRPPKERLTTLELSGRIPLEKEVTVYVFPTNWSNFRTILRKTLGAVTESFRGTHLEHKISIYEESIPKEKEGPASFFYRSSIAILPEAPNKDVAKIMEELKKAKEEEVIDPSAVFRYFPYYLKRGIYTGEEIVESDSKVIKDKKKKRLIVRVAGTRRKYDLGFAAGFNSNKEWFYAFGYTEDSDEKIYGELQQNIRIHIDELVLLRGEKFTDEEGTKYLIFR